MKRTTKFRTLFLVGIAAHNGYSQNLVSEARALQNEINGGKDRPTEVYVRTLKNAFVLEGSVDKAQQKKTALENCILFAKHANLYAKSGFKNPEEMCVSRIRVRMGPPVDPPSSYQVEYRVLFFPDTTINPEGLLWLDYEKVGAYTKNALQSGSLSLRTIADTVYEERVLRNLAYISADENPQSLVPQETASSETSQLIHIDARAKAFFDSSKKYIFSAKTKVFSYNGTDKIHLAADVTISEEGGSSQILKIKADTKLSHQETLPLGSVVKLGDKNVPGLVVLARISKHR